MNKFCKYLCKIALAGIAAVICVSAFCYFYYNLPAHEPTSSGATDHAWTTSHISIRGTEGFAYTKTDAYGYVNTFPHKKEATDILLMGSSHTEGFNVNANQNYAYLLNQKLYDSDFDMYAYNIGMSSHDLGRCLNNLENALTAYQPSKYVILETHSTRITMSMMQQLLTDTYEPISSSKSGIAYHLQKIDFLRLMYSQLKSLSNNKNKQTSATNTLPDEYASYVDQTIQKAADIAQSHNCTLVILYSPTLSVDYTGDVIPPEYSEALAALETACQKYGVVFLNAQAAYENMYAESNRLPHGFTNTAVGTGHLNKYGHACIADMLFDFITEEDC